MQFAVLLLTVVGAHQALGKIQREPIHKCNGDALKWVKVIWKATEIPSDLVSKNDKNGKIGLVASSEDYKKTKQCEIATFKGNTATWDLTNSNGDKSSYSEQLVEDSATPGVVTSDDGTIQRHFVFSKDGVDAFYICSTNGPKGKPQGGVTAKYGPLDKDTLNLVDYASALLQYVGADMNETNVKQCFPKSKK